MKCIKLFGCTLACVVVLCGCSARATEKTGESDILKDRITGDYQEVIENVGNFSYGDGDVDVDLTALSSLMVYAEVYNMMVDPEAYIGKSVRLSGPLYREYYEVTEQFYHYVIIEDATACCVQGIEVKMEEYTSPDDYPEENSVIEVEGIFNAYEELGLTYYYLDANAFQIL